MPTVIENIKFYTIPETAQALRVTPQTIRAWIKQGRLKSQRIGRPIFITESNLLEFLAPSKSTLQKIRDKVKEEANIS
jgi:excisionase family DNA binding protein